jgi:hypothetical protein
LGRIMRNVQDGPCIFHCSLIFLLIVAWAVLRGTNVCRLGPTEERDSYQRIGAQEGLND